LLKELYTELEAEFEKLKSPFETEEEEKRKEVAVIVPTPAPRTDSVESLRMMTNEAQPSDVVEIASPKL